MADYIALAEKASDSLISAVKQANGITSATVASVSDFVADFLPPMPLADRYPAPRKVVEATFGIWERMLDAQKAYALSLVEAMAPITSKVTKANGRASKKSGSEAV